MPGHFSSMSQQAARFERSMQCTPAALSRPRGDTHRTALRRIDNLQDLDMSVPILQRAAAGHRQPALQFPRNVLGAALLLWMAQQANASLIGEGMGGEPAARGPAPPEADPARWPTPRDVVDGHAHQRALVGGGGGWPPGAAAADTRIPLQALPGSEATAAADRLLHDEAGTVVPPAPPALAFAAGACIRNKRLCAAAIAGAGVYAAADLLGTLYRPVLQRHWQAVQAALAPAPAALPRFTLDLDALPPQARWNASGRDPARPPCTSLGNHINGRWQDTEALERSRTQQGTFVDLRDRSLAIRQQLARQVATLPDPSPAEKLVSDLWSAGMDEGRVDVLGITPLRPALDAIDALDTTAALSTFLFAQTARGRNALFQLNALPDMEHPDRLMAYLSQGGLGLPDADWYTHPQMAPRVDAYRSYIIRMLSLSGLPAVDAAQAAGEVALPWKKCLPPPRYPSPASPTTSRLTTTRKRLPKHPRRHRDCNGRHCLNSMAWMRPDSCRLACRTISGAWIPCSTRFLYRPGSITCASMHWTMPLPAWHNGSRWHTPTSMTACSRGGVRRSRAGRGSWTSSTRTPGWP